MTPMSFSRLQIKRRPVRGTLVRYRDRIVEVMGEARGQRVMIRSVHSDGVERRTAVKWVKLLPLDQQLSKQRPPSCAAGVEHGHPSSALIRRCSLRTAANQTTRPDLR
jgi:hypothetical protein